MSEKRIPLEVHVSYESTAEPIKVGYLMDFTLPPGFPDEMKADFTQVFDIVFDEAVEQGLLDRPVQMIYREVEGLPKGSVKAVIDAYNGSVTFYVFDRDDPIINAYRHVLPELFKDAQEMPANLRRHIRYPEDIFTVQAEMYGTYHMTNPTTFYNREDRWEVPHELYRSNEIAMLPYYVTTQLPGSGKLEFLLMLPLSVAGKNQMAGWLAGLCDGETFADVLLRP